MSDSSSDSEDVWAAMFDSTDEEEDDGGAPAAKVLRRKNPQQEGGAVPSSAQVKNPKEPEKTDLHTSKQTQANAKTDENVLEKQSNSEAPGSRKREVLAERGPVIRRGEVLQLKQETKSEEGLSGIRRHRGGFFGGCRRQKSTFLNEAQAIDAELEKLQATVSKEVETRDADNAELDFLAEEEQVVREGEDEEVVLLEKDAVSDLQESDPADVSKDALMKNQEDENAKPPVSNEEDIMLGPLPEVPPAVPVPDHLSSTWNQAKYPALGPNARKSLAEIRKTQPIIVHDSFLVPAFIVAHLRPYQVEGIRWLMRNLLDPQKPIGCLLGDDMGLGKTVQVVVTVGALYFSKVVSPVVSSAVASTSFGSSSANQQAVINKVPRATLVVAPPSLLENWKNEFLRWGHFDVEIWSQSTAARTVERVNSGLCNVVVASRGLFSQASSSGDLLLQQWGLLVIDEVHECKNPNTSLSQNISKIRSRRKLGLTGTPVANKIGEFWALLKCIGVSKLYGTREEFDLKYSAPISEGMKKGTDVLKIAARDRAAKEFQEKILKTHFLRRTKAEASLDLPGKRDRIVACPLSAVQHRCYENLLRSKDVQAVLYGGKNVSTTAANNGTETANYMDLKNFAVDRDTNRARFLGCICSLKSIKHCACNMGVIWRNQHAHLEDNKCRSYNHPWKCHALSLMSYLQKIANHLDLLHDFIFKDPQLLTSEERERRRFELALCKVIFEGTDLEQVLQGLVEDESASASDNKKQGQLIKPATSSNMSGAVLLQKSSAKNCGKLQMLVKLMKLWRDDSAAQNKVLIFSRSTKILNIIEFTIKAQGFRILRLDGKTPHTQRQPLCSDFNQNPDIFAFLISTRAGGVGLNLTAANKVVIFDPDWNPCMDLQAQDRSFRIGQTRFVEVFRLFSAGTIEEHVYMRQLYKQQLMKVSIDSVKTARRLNDEQLQGIERFFTLDGSRLTNVIIDDLPQNVNLLDDEREMESLERESAQEALGVSEEENGIGEEANQLGHAAVRDRDKESKRDLTSSEDDFGDFFRSSGKQVQKTSTDHVNDRTGRGQVEWQAQNTRTGAQASSSNYSANNLANLLTSPAAGGLQQILGDCQQFDHDDCLRQDSQEDELALEAEQVYLSTVADHNIFHPSTSHASEMNNTNPWNSSTGGRGPLGSPVGTTSGGTHLHVGGSTDSSAGPASSRGAVGRLNHANLPISMDELNIDLTGEGEEVDDNYMARNRNRINFSSAKSKAGGARKRRKTEG